MEFPVSFWVHPQCVSLVICIWFHVWYGFNDKIKMTTPISTYREGNKWIKSVIKKVLNKGGLFHFPPIICIRAITQKTINWYRFIIIILHKNLMFIYHCYINSLSAYIRISCKIYVQLLTPFTNTRAWKILNELMKRLTWCFLFS